MPEPRRMPENRKVRRELLSIHIFLIVISGTIGMGLFDNSGEILRTAGPAGGITAFGLVGIGVIMIMEGVAEMIAHWPISNAMFEFVKVFVDKELALVVGFGYWLAYSVSFGTLICAASNLAARWTWPTSVQDIVFVVFTPLVLLSLNCLGVKWYGNVEAFCGVLKIILVVGSFLAMCVINKLDTQNAIPPQSTGRATFINAGFQHDPAVSAHPIIAIFVAMPIATYAYIGVEIVAVTAVEAKEPKKSLRLSARNIAWITGLFYFACVIIFYFNVYWKDPRLPGYHLRDGLASGSNSSTALIIIAAENAKVEALPSVLTTFLIIAVLSAANTALYVASRTLWGVACDFDSNLIDSQNPLKRWFSKLSTTTPRKVPGWALFASCLFIWIPILQAVSQNGVFNQNLQQVMSGIATAGVVLVWASQCIALIRYRKWLWANRSELIGAYAAFDHFNNENDTIPFNSRVGWTQTAPAWIGLSFCILIVFVFSTASWWNHKEEKDSDIPAAFAAPAGLFLIWVVLKFIRWYRPVEEFELAIGVGTWLGPNGLKAKLDGLTAAIKSLEAERNDPAMQLQNLSSGSSQRELQVGATHPDGQNLSVTPQSTHSGNVSARDFDPQIDNTGNTGSISAGGAFIPDSRNQDDREGSYQDPSSQSTGSGVPRSPPRRRTSLLTHPRYQAV